MKRLLPLLPLLVLGTVSGAAWALHTNPKVALDGDIISTKIQTINGKAYIPLEDIARVLSRKIVRTGNDYSLIPTETEHPLQGFTSPFTKNVYSGRWRFNVESVRMVTQYQRVHGSEKTLIMPREASDVLVAVTCHLKNGSKEMQEVYFDSTSSGNTALTDDQQHGYVPVAYDSRNSDYSSSRMPSGTLHDFIIVFSVPKGTTLKNLVYSVGGVGVDKTTDFRVSLKP